ARRLVELCELAEMTPSASLWDFVGSDGSPALESPAAGGANDGPHALVTQMALLLYLGEYVHARHLWRRHRGAPRGGSARNDASSDYAQLEQLWNAARYCYLWKTGGIHNLTSSAVRVSGESMQVENENLPYSTLALRSLQACHDTQMEPLATYSAELLGVFRSRVNRVLHRSFKKLHCKEFCLRMNLEPEGGIWPAFGWNSVQEGGYILSDGSVVFEDEEEDALDCTEEDRIGNLSDIVMFLEGKMNTS
ncbi:hypothetical protein ACHAWF_003713, partial [Thalassiosira exigua]